MLSRPHATHAQLIERLRAKNLLTPLVQSAIAQAQKSHADHVRDNGASVITEHICPIVLDLIETLHKRSVNQELIAIALLHDALEDDPQFTVDICSKMFYPELTHKLQILTKPPKPPNATAVDKSRRNSQHFKYILRHSTDVIYVKVADRYNNLSSSITPTSKNFRYLKESEQIYMPHLNQYAPEYLPKYKHKIAQLQEEFAVSQHW